VTELRRRDRWLLIFDKAEEPNALKPFLPGGDGHVIVTSMQRGWDTLGISIDVDVMQRVESTTLLRRRVPGIAVEVADTIAERLGDLPLAMASKPLAVSLGTAGPSRPACPGYFATAASYAATTAKLSTSEPSPASPAPSLPTADSAKQSTDTRP
jgi:hypothetical protein